MLMKTMTCVLRVKVTGSNPEPVEYDKNAREFHNKESYYPEQALERDRGLSMSEDRALGVQGDTIYQGGSPGSSLAHLWKLSTILRWTRRSFLVR